MIRLLLTLLCSSLTTSAVNFNRDIKPILAKKCFTCHGKEKQKGKLRLDLRNEALKSAITPRSLEKSELIKRILHTDPDEIMPPPKEGNLSETEKEILKNWIKEGAAYDTHWAFKSLEPEKRKEESYLDQLILTKLAKAGLKQETQAPKHTLIRRLSQTLTGLPPNEKLREDFVNGNITYKQAVEKLLNSPRYGEKMAIFWLDGARYADTNGIEYDNSRPIWPYKNWVIKAFNDDMPYNQFVIEQLAGDLLPKPTTAQLVATGFNRCNLSTNETGSIEAEFQYRYAKDRLNTSATVFMGLTVGCAECHDHKFDPISQKEYFQMLAFFNNIEGRAVGQTRDRSDPPLTPIISEDKAQKFQKSIKNQSALKATMAAIEGKVENDFFFWHIEQLANPAKAPFLIAKLDAYFSLNNSKKMKAFNLITEHNCNIKGEAYIVDGKYGQGLNFKSSTFVDCLNIANYSKDQKFSLGLWIKPYKNITGTILARYNSRLEKGWRLFWKDGAITMEIRNDLTHGISLKTIKAPHFTKWSHLTITYDGSSKAAGVKIYINGTKVQSQVNSDNLNGSIKINNNLRIAAESKNLRNLTGASLDEVFIASRQLSNKEIKTIAGFDARSRFALAKPADLDANSKAILLKHYLEKAHKTYSLLHRQNNQLKEAQSLVLRSSTTSMIMKEKIGITPTYILERGNYEKKGIQVQRDFPAFLPSQNKYPKNRLGFAQWLTAKEHPLTARVIVNRIWQNIFGQGLVRTPGDLGTQGEYPTHPKILDYLANYLQKNNWSLKKLTRHILSSSTFKIHSRISRKSFLNDPENKLLSHFPRRRLTAEAIRDHALKVSHLLNHELGGKPVRPYQPPNLWKSVTANTSNTFIFNQSKGTDNYRRSLYTFWKRNSPPPSMVIFNAPSRQTCTMQRSISNTPLQALVLLNDPQFVELQKHLADSIQPLPLTTKEKLKYLYLRLFGRKPTEHENLICSKFLNNSFNNWFPLTQALMNSDEFSSIE